jgi:Metallo-peptidase family M12/Secretion system C-terminal sorting domain
MKNSIILLIVAFLLGNSIDGNAQSKGQIAKKLAEKSKAGEFFTHKNLLDVATNYDYSRINDDVVKATVFNLNEAKAQEIINQSLDLISIELKISNSEIISLDLYKETEAFSTLAINTSDGKEFDLNELKAVFYRGTIKDNPNSVVSISIFENEISGFISSEDGNLVLGKLKNSNQIVLYNDKDLRKKPDFECSMPDSFLNDSEITNYQNVFSKTLTLKCVRLYFETEFDIYQNLGNSVPNVVNYVTNLYNQVGTLYANDGISTALSQVFVWTTADPYTATDTANLLSQFQAQTSSINGNLGQLITFRSVGGGRAAGFSGICNSNVDLSLSVSGNMNSTVVAVPTYSWNVMVVTHEFGHLFGSRHTHACVWNGNNTAIDGCSGITEGGCPLPGIPSGGGTIMSYCHIQSVGINFNNGFGPQPTAVITNNVTNGTCLTSCIPCPNDLVITTNVASPDIDYRQAASKITATNTIANGATGIYHAGSQLVFQNGFNADTGSTFRAYVEGCTDSFVAKHFLYQEPISSYNDATENLILAPNPNNGIFSLNLKEPTNGTIQITDLYGSLVLEQTFKDDYQFDINIQEKPKGIYIVKIFTDKSTLIGKIIKN